MISAENTLSARVCIVTQSHEAETESANELSQEIAPFCAK